MNRIGSGLLPFFLAALVSTIAAGCDETPTEEQGAATVAAEPAQDPLQNIRDRYAAAMRLQPVNQEFSCEPMSGSVKIRRDDKEIVWIGYLAGYPHGSRSIELLLDGQDIIFILLAESQWSFDVKAPRNEEGHSHSLDSEKQERYYFQQGKLLRALLKEASARSVAHEKLDEKIAAAANKPHPAPDSQLALKTGAALRNTVRAGAIAKTWCGPES